MYHTYVLEALALQIMKSAHADARRRRMAACARTGTPAPLCSNASQEYDRRLDAPRRRGAAQRESQGGAA